MCRSVRVNWVWHRQAARVAAVVAVRVAAVLLRVLQRLLLRVLLRVLQRLLLRVLQLGGNRTSWTRISC